MHADRTNRIALLVLAVLLIAVGADAGSASLGVFGDTTRHSTLFANPTGKFFGSNGDWLWPVMAVAALILALLALRWLIALLFSTDRSGDLPLPASGPTGRTTLTAGALTRAVTEEIDGYRGVSSARARLIGDPEDPELVVTVTAEQSADMAELRQRIETGALTHARMSTGNPELPIQLDLTVTTKGSARVS